MIYVTLAKLGVSCEHIYYKIAVFIDKHIYQSRKARIVSSSLLSINILLVQGADSFLDDTRHVINAYLAVLMRGSTYLHHAMPRLITIWLNFCQKVCAVGDLAWPSVRVSAA